MTPRAETVARLCEVSAVERRPFARSQDWPAELDREQWFFAPELISLRGTETFDRLDEGARKVLSFYEAVNFFSLNIHGERSLVEGIARRLHTEGNESISHYLHHFLEEENGHMTWFAGFCTRYAGKIYPEKRLALEREYANGEEDFLFFARALVFEEIVDAYNRRMADDERLDPLARTINRMHHLEEKRHLAFGRELVVELHERHRREWSSETHARIASELSAFLRSTWNLYYNAEVYQDAGLRRPYSLRRQAFDSPTARAHRDAIGASCERFLREHGILDGSGR